MYSDIQTAIDELSGPIQKLSALYEEGRATLNKAVEVDLRSRARNSSGQIAARRPGAVLAASRS